MNLLHLRSFVVLAKELHYHRAAERLFISQPGLSKRIRQLERDLEVQLFKRNTRNVDLTYSGLYLLKQAQHLLDMSARISSQLRVIEQGAEGEVRIGFVGSAMQKVIPDLVMRSNVSFPSVSFAMEELSISRQISLIQSEQIDIGFVRLAKVPNDINIRPVYEEKFSLVLPESHPLSSDTFTGLDQLKKESFILFSSEYSSDYYYNKIMSIFDDAGFDPLISNRSINANIIFKLVGSGFGVSIVPTSLATDFNLPIKLIELKHIRQTAILSIVWKKELHSNLIKNVLSLIDQ